MRGLCYQLKSVWKEKFCILSFLLPIIVALALRFGGGIDLSSVAEFHFGVWEGGASKQIILWLERYGTVTLYETQAELAKAVNDTSTNLIGVTADGDGIQTMVSGDELDIFRQTANTLPGLYARRDSAEQIHVTILERHDVMDGLANIFNAMILLAAMFMGCTFNAMNIISEKENGVELVNQILPMSHSQYVMQKLLVGFAGGCLSAVLTAVICFSLSFAHAFLMLVLIILSAFTAALLGMFIGRFSSNFMVGVAYIKMIMIVFMAVPMLAWLLGADGFVLTLCYLVPFTPVFEGIMHLANEGNGLPAKDMVVLLAHCVIWLGGYLILFHASLRPACSSRKVL